MATKRATKKVVAKKRTARKTATKRVARAKKVVAATEKVDFTDSYQQVTKTAKVVNKEVRQAITEITTDILENSVIIGKASAKEATKLAKKINKAVTVKNIKKTSDNIKQAGFDINEYTLASAEELVDGVLATGEKWQSVTNKAIKGGLKLAAKQQNIVFDTMDAVKGQFSSNVVRMKKFFSKN